METNEKLPDTTPAENNGNTDVAATNDGSVVEQFVGVPIESLICGPIVAAAKGQQELTAV